MSLLTANRQKTKLFPNPVSYWTMYTSNAKGNEKNIASTSRSYGRQTDKKSGTKKNRCYTLKLLIYLIVRSTATFLLTD